MKKRWYFINPEGRLTWTNNLAKFCRDNGLKYRSMQYLADGTFTECRGWLSTHPKAKKKRKKREKTIVNLVTLERVKITRPKKFASMNNYTLQRVSSLLNKHQMIYKDWMLEEHYNTISSYA